MRTVRVGDVASQVRGVTYDKSEASRDWRPGTVGVARAGNIRAGEYVDADLVYVPTELVSEKQLLRQGDVLVATSSGSLDVVGKAARVRANVNVAFGAFCKVLRPDAYVDPSYFAHYFQTSEYRQHVARVAVGANINNLKNRDLDDLQIPLPPIEEQRRIAAVLDAAAALRAKRRQAIAKLDTLTQSIFIDMFGDPARNVHGFREAALGEVVKVRGGKRLPKGAEYAPSPTAFPYIRVTDFRGGAIGPDDLRYLTPEVQRTIQRYTVSAGDVLISIAGSIGQIAPVPAELHGANLTENAAVLIRHDPGQLQTEYLAGYLRSPYAQDQIAASTGQVTIGKLALFRIEALKILLPPTTLQLRFDGMVTALSRSASRYSAQLTRLDGLFASLQQRAFRGEL